MCRALFVGTHQAMPLAPDEQAAAHHLSVEGVTTSSALIGLPPPVLRPLLRRVLRQPHLYRVDTATGCGCGFEFADGSFGSDIEAWQANMSALTHLLSNWLDVLGELELYTDWDFEVMPQQELSELSALETWPFIIGQPVWLRLVSTR